MAINTNPLNTSGLASYAGSRIGNLGLDIQPDFGGMRIQAQERMANQKNALARQQMMQQQGLARQKMDMARQKMAADQQMKERQMEYAQMMGMEKLKMQKEATAEKQAMFQQKLDEQSKKEAEQLDEKTISKKAGAAQMLILSPEINADNDKVKEFMKPLVKQGVFSQEEAEQIVSMDPDSRITAAKAQLAISGKALQFSKALGKDKKGKASTDLTAPVKTQAQKAVISAEENIGALDDLEKTFQEDFLGAGGATKKAVYGAQDWLGTLPVVGESLKPGQEGKDWLKNYSGFISKTQNLAMTIIKQLSGVQYSDKQLEFLQTIVPQAKDSPEMFKGKLKGLKEKMGQLQGVNEQLLEQGIKAGSKEYKQQWLEKAKSIMTGGSTSTKQEPQYDEADIQHTMKVNGMTREQVMEALRGRK